MIGAHGRLLAYDLAQPARLWEDDTFIECHSWRQWGSYVLLAGELELAAWYVQGRTLWSADVEPPWEYAVAGDAVELTVMGHDMTFPVATGPSWGLQQAVTHSDP